MKDPRGVAVLPEILLSGLARSGVHCSAFEERCDRVFQVGSPSVIQAIQRTELMKCASLELKTCGSSGRPKPLRAIH